MAVIRNVLGTGLFLLAFGALAAPPSASDIAACQGGKQHGLTTVTEIPFQALNADDDYWQGYAASTVAFKGKVIGYAQKGDDQGIAYNGRVYPIARAVAMNMPRADFDDQIKRGTVGVNQPSDWYWLKGKQAFVCIATNKSMEKAAPVLFFLSTGKVKRVYVTLGTPAAN